MNALGRFLKTAIDKRGWTQKDLADKSGIKPSNISRLIKGKVEEPELSTLVRLSEALNTPLGHLIELAGFSIGPMGTPESQQIRLWVLTQQMPEIAAIAEELASLPPDDLKSVLDHLETVRRRRSHQTHEVHRDRQRRIED